MPLFEVMDGFGGNGLDIVFKPGPGSTQRSGGAFVIGRAISTKNELDGAINALVKELEEVRRVAARRFPVNQQ
jgi:hypothetical protein